MERGGGGSTALMMEATRDWGESSSGMRREMVDCAFRRGRRERRARGRDSILGGVWLYVLRCRYGIEAGQSSRCKER